MSKEASAALDGRADPADHFARVDGVRAGCDAIRRDNPRLLIRSEQRRADRTAVSRKAPSRSPSPATAPRSAGQVLHRR
jgi:hypothetical protein